MAWDNGMTLMKAHEAVVESLRTLGWDGHKSDPREWAKRATVPRDARYYFINGVPHRAVEAIAPDADRCVPVDGGPPVVVKYQTPMHSDDMARELARLRAEPVATVEGEIEGYDFPDGANVACIEVGDDNGDHVRLIIERGHGLRLAAEWPGRLEITVRRKGAK